MASHDTAAAQRGGRSEDRDRFSSSQGWQFGFSLASARFRTGVGVGVAPSGGTRMMSLLLQQSLVFRLPMMWIWYGPDGSGCAVAGGVNAGAADTTTSDRK